MKHVERAEGGWESYIEDLKEIGCENVDWILRAEGDQW